MSVTSAPKRMNVNVNGKTLTCLMLDNSAVDDLLSKLPMKVKMEDFIGQEKITYDAGSLNIKGAKAGGHYKTGDIIYYIPWKTLCFIYNVSNGGNDDIVLLGSVESGIENLKIKGKFEIELTK